MADLEKREDQKIRECLQQAYGYSDEQLLKKMEEAEKSLEDTDFPGAEERIFQKLMERKAAEEEKEERAGKPAQMPEPAPSGASVSGGAAPKRFGKRKLAISAALAAAFAVLLGITAIGRSYFLRERKNELNVTIINNNQNKKNISQIEEAYQLIETELGIPVLRLEYVPSNLDFQGAVWKENSVTMQFYYDENIVMLYEGKESDNISVGIESDRVQSKKVFNKWLNQEVVYLENELKNGEIEYETLLTIDENVYYFSGIMPEEEFVKIIKFFSLKVS